MAQKHVLFSVLDWTVDCGICGSRLVYSAAPGHEQQALAGLGWKPYSHGQGRRWKCPRHIQGATHMGTVKDSIRHVEGQLHAIRREADHLARRDAEGLPPAEYWVQAMGRIQESCKDALSELGRLREHTAEPLGEAMTHRDAVACLTHWAGLPEAAQYQDEELELVAVTHDGASFYLLLWDEGEGLAQFTSKVDYLGHFQKVLDQRRSNRRVWESTHTTPGDQP